MPVPMGTRFILQDQDSIPATTLSIGKISRLINKFLLNSSLRTVCSFTEKEKAEFRRHQRGQGNMNHDNYYGIKGIKRLPNSVIFAACIAIAFIGGTIQMLVIKYDA